MRIKRKQTDKILDRIDIQVEILPVPFKALSERKPGETSEQIRKRVIAARNIHDARFASEPNVRCNAQMTSRLIRKWVVLSDESKAILEKVMTKYDMSARAYDRILKVARTIADIEASPDILPAHIAEAVSYRNLDRSSWGHTGSLPISHNPQS